MFISKKRVKWFYITALTLFITSIILHSLITLEIQAEWIYSLRDNLMDVSLIMIISMFALLWNRSWLDV